MRVEVDAASRRLGESFTAEQAAGFIRRMGAPVRVEGSTLVVAPPEYRNDFIHLDADERRRRWRVAVSESRRLADEFAELSRQDTIQALSL